jgi:hypothetical protein
MLLVVLYTLKIEAVNVSEVWVNLYETAVRTSDPTQSGSWLGNRRSQRFF